MWKMKGYFVSDGYMGMLPDGAYRLFASEQDYKDYIDDNNSEDKEV